MLERKQQISFKFRSVRPFIKRTNTLKVTKAVEFRTTMFLNLLRVTGKKLSILTVVLKDKQKLRLTHDVRDVKE